MSNIELSTVVFHEGSLPSVLPLWNCSVPLVSPVPDALTAIYGTSGKRHALGVVGKYAKSNQLQHTVIDLTVTLEHRPNPTVMRAETLGSHDFFSMLRMATSMEGQIVEWIRAGLAPGDRRAKLFDEMLPTQVLAGAKIAQAIPSRRRFLLRGCLLQHADVAPVNVCDGLPVNHRAGHFVRCHQHSGC